MIHDIHPLQSLPYKLRVPHVADDQFDLFIQILRAENTGSMHLRRQAIQRANPMAASEERIGKV
jgi:hypothetical protein